MTDTPAVGDRGTGNRLGGNVALAAPETLPIPLAAKPRWPSPAVPNALDQIAHSVSIRDGSYLVHFAYGGRPYVWAVNEGVLERRHDLRVFLNTAQVYQTRQGALEALVPHILRGGAQMYAGFSWLPGLPVAVPTMVSDVTAPRIMAGIEAKDEDMRQAARAVEEEMKGLRTGMLIGKALGEAYGGARNPNGLLARRIGGALGAPRGPQGGTGQAAPSAPSSVPSSAPPVVPQPKTGSGTSSGTGPPRSGATSSTAPPAGGGTKGTEPPARGKETSSADPRFRQPPKPGVDGYRTAPGEVIGQTAPTSEPISNTTIGREREALLPAVMQQRFTESQFRYEYGSGTPDVEWIGGRDPGFDVADLKPVSRPPDYGSHQKFITQVRLWAHQGWRGRQAPKTFRAAMISYTPEGYYFIEDVVVVGQEYTTPIEDLAKPAKPTKK